MRQVGLHCSFQDTAIANSDTKTQPWHSDGIALIQFRGLSANRKYSKPPAIVSTGDKSRLLSNRSLKGERTAQACAIAWLHHLRNRTCKLSIPTLRMIGAYGPELALNIYCTIKVRFVL